MKINAKTVGTVHTHTDNSKEKEVMIYVIA